MGGGVQELVRSQFPHTHTHKTHGRGMEAALSRGGGGWGGGVIDRAVGCTAQTENSVLPVATFRLSSGAPRRAPILPVWCHPVLPLGACRGVMPHLARLAFAYLSIG